MSSAGDESIVLVKMLISASKKDGAFDDVLKLFRDVSAEKEASGLGWASRNRTCKVCSSFSPVIIKRVGMHFVVNNGRSRLLLEESDYFVIH